MFNIQITLYLDNHQLTLNENQRKLVENALMDTHLNQKQREVVGKALIEMNKLLLIQGPPGRKRYLL